MLVRAIALGYLLLHLATAGRYGYFRDALYYLACSRHLAFGYVDQPPLIALLGWIASHTLGTSLPALIFWPALAGALRILLVARFAQRQGAGGFGTALAALLAATPAVSWVIDHQFAMNAWEPLFWLGSAYTVLCMIDTGNPRLWIVFGAMAGLGLENKYSIAFFVVALIAGLLLTPERRVLFTPWIFAGAGVALLVFLPNLIWNIQHQWPFLELMRNIRESGKDVVLGPFAYLGQQMAMVNPLSLPFWLGGLGFVLFAPSMRRYRAFGFAFVITIGLFLVMHGKDYYSAPVYGLVLAAGAVGAERLLANRRVLQAACFAWLLVAIGLLLPLMLPVLSLEALVRYQSRLPFQPAKTEKSFEGAVLPQYYADELPWEPMVAAVARVYRSLSPEERAKTAIFCANYGEAAALDFFGPKYGLPPAISGHQNYYLWGPRGYDGSIVIVVGQRAESERKDFASVREAAEVNVPYALSYETGPVLLCRGLKWDLQSEWSKVKRWL